MEYNFPLKEKNLNLYLRWHILRSYCFVAEVIFNDLGATYVSTSMTDYSQQI